MMIDDKWYPDELPGQWVFPAPPVCTRQWTARDWVLYAAPYNSLSLEFMRIDRDIPSHVRKHLATEIRWAARRPGGN